MTKTAAAPLQTATPSPPLPLYPYEPVDFDRADSRTAPFDGNMVLLSDDETKPGVPAKWHTTRRRAGYTWKPWMGFVHAKTKQPLGFEPTCWRPAAWTDLV